MASTRRAADVFFDVDEGDFLRDLDRVEGRVDLLLGAVARDLADNLEEEGGAIYPALGEPWDIEKGLTQVRVHAPEDAWWAHFVAGGTKDHGPRAADRMVFTVDGETVAAEHVAGVPATGFDKRAISRTRSKMAVLLRRVVV